MNYTLFSAHSKSTAHVHEININDLRSTEVDFTLSPAHFHQTITRMPHLQNIIQLKFSDLSSSIESLQSPKIISFRAVARSL